MVTRQKLGKEETKRRLIDIYENSLMGIGYIIDEAWEQAKFEESSNLKDLSKDYIDKNKEFIKKLSNK